MKRYFLYDPKAKKYGQCFVRKQDAEEVRSIYIRRTEERCKRWGKSEYTFYAKEARQEFAYWKRVVIREFSMKCVAEY